MKERLTFALPLILVACGEPQSAEEELKWDAIAACIDRSSIFSELLKMDSRTDSIEIGDVDNAVFRVGIDGHFVMEMPNVAPKRTTSFVWTCAGNMKKRIVELVDFNGMTKRPPPGQVWGFE